MKGIDIRNLDFSYGEKWIWKDFQGFFPEGEVSVLMAPSGRGKTTLLYLIAGLLQPTEGSIVYPQDTRKCAMVFQDGRLVEQLSVEKNIKLVNSRITTAQMADCLRELGLAGMEKKKVAKLSGGERQRVAIARGLLAEYDLLLLDEPFTGLDDEIKERVIKVMKARTAGKTVLLVTHDRQEALLMGGQIYDQF